MTVTRAEFEAFGFRSADDDTALEVALQRANTLLDAITGNRCTDSGSLPALKQIALKKAICAQAEFQLEQNRLSGGSGMSVKLGDFSLTSEREDFPDLLSPFAMALLKLNGLYQIRAEVV